MTALRAWPRVRSRDYHRPVRLVLASVALVAASCSTTLAPCELLTASGDYACGVPGWDERGYTIHLPSTWSPTTAVPVLLAFHGGAGDREAMQLLTCANGELGDPSCLDALADREGFAVVYPDGTSAPVFAGLRSWNAGGGERGLRCVSGPACRDDVDDEAYVLRLLEELARVANIDRARVYATGFSNGAAMVQRLACAMPDRIAAIAAVSGANQFGAAQGCSPSRAVPVLAVHGEKDPCWAFGGGFGACLQEDGDMYIGVRASIDAWAARNGCGLEPAVTTLEDVSPGDGTLVHREVWSGCRAPVELLRVENGGHTWPNGHQYLAERTIGATTRDLDGNATMWRFLSAHVLPR